MDKGRWGIGMALAALLLGAAAAPAWAGDQDYSDEDFSVRLASAFIRFTEVTAGDGGTAASRFSPAVNPASMAWGLPPTRYGVTVGPYWSRIWFDEGTELDVFGEGVMWDTKRFGVIMPVANQMRTNRATTKQGTVFDYSVDGIHLQWAKRFGCWAVGADVNYNKAEVQQDLGPIRILDSEADTWRFRLGGLHQPARNWLIGAVVEYGRADYSRDLMIPLPTGAIVASSDTGTQEQIVLRPGVSYAYGEYSSVFLDYQYGNFWRGGERLHSHWFHGGVNHAILPFLHLQIGVNADVRGNWVGRAGIGIHFAKWGSLHAAYHYDRFPELRPEFGRSDTIELAVSIRL